MEKVKLKDILEITSSRRIFASDYVSSGIPFFRGKEIAQKERGENVTDLLFISHKKFDEIKKNNPIPQQGDILLTSVGSIGIPYLVGEEEFYFKDGNLTWFRNFNKIIDSKFLYYWMLSDAFKQQIFNTNIWAVQKALTIVGLEELEIFLPPLPTQRRISRVLSLLDDKIELNHKIADEFSALARTLYEWHFVQLRIKNEELRGEKWKMEKLKDVAIIKTGKEDANFATSNGKYKFFTCAEQPLQCDMPAFSGEAILIAGNGNFNVKYNGNEQFNAYQRTYVVQAKEGKENEIFRMFYAVADTIEKFKRGSNGSIIKFITLGDVENVELPIPDTATLTKFSAVAKPIFAQIVQTRQQSAQLAKLRDFLLPLLMNGEMDVLHFKEGSK